MPLWRMVTRWKMEYFSSNAGGMFHTWRQRFPDGQPEQITSGPTEEEGIALAPDGHSFVTAVGVRQSSIWVHDGKGDRQISLEGRAFQPKFTPDGTKLLYRIRSGPASELWVADLGSNRSEPLLPGFRIPVAADFGASLSMGYDISADGRQLVFYSPDSVGKLRLWLAPLDRRSPPRQVPDVEGEQPLFGPVGEIFFRKIEKNSAFLYSVREDGTGLRKAAESPVLSLFCFHPSQKWVLIGISTGGESIFPAGGGSPMVTHLGPPPRLSWTRDGKYLFAAGGTNLRWANTYVVPLSSGEVLPASILRAKSFPAEAELAKWPGTRTIPVADVVPGPTADVYAFTRETVQRNLYRIPLP